jgi:hypothetical protein
MNAPLAYLKGNYSRNYEFLVIIATSMTFLSCQKFSLQKSMGMLIKYSDL